MYYTLFLPPAQDVFAFNMASLGSRRESPRPAFFVFRSPYFVLLPSSLVLRKPPSLVQKWGIQWGRSPLGREEGPRGTFMEWFPGRVFAFFRRAAKEGRSRGSETSLVLSSSRRSGQNPRPRHCEPPQEAWQSVPSSRVRHDREPDGGFSRCGATPFLLAEKKRGKETARGDLFRGGPPWTPSPTAKGAPPPLDSPLLDEGRRTKDGRRRTRDEKLYTGKAAIILKLTTLPQPPASMAEGQFVYCENNHAIKKSFCPFNRQPL